MSKTACTEIKNLILSQKKEIVTLSTLFFLATAVFWILKPIKKGVFISYFKTNALELAGTHLNGAQTEQLAKLTLVLTALLMAYLFSAAIRQFSPRKLLVLTSLLGILGSLFFSFGLQMGKAKIIWAFYLFGDLQNSLIIILLWSILHNTFQLKEAKYVFTLVSLSGLIGGLSGTFFVQHTLIYFGREMIVLICAGMFGLIALVGNRYLDKLILTEKSLVSDDISSNANLSVAIESNTDNGNWKALGKLKYWMAIALIVGLYEMISGIIDFQLSLTVERLNSSEIEKDIYFGYVGTAQNLVALLVQLFLTGFVIRHWGLKTALLILPLTILLGSVGFLVVPSLAGAMFLAVSDNGLNYSLNQQAKETLYVPTEPEERLRAKAFIDLFVQRFAKAVAVGLNLIVVAGNGLDATRWLSLIVVSLAVLWILVVNFTGKEFERLVLMNSSQ
jgi:ATP:ADP antiporter, AAA family